MNFSPPMYSGTSMVELYIALYVLNNSSLSALPGSYDFTGSLVATGTLKTPLDIFFSLFSNCCKFIGIYHHNKSFEVSF